MLSAEALDRVINETIESVEKAKGQIFSIAEDARSECARVQQELVDIREQTLDVIKQVDAITIVERQARNRLMVVSRDLHLYSEDDIRQAYEAAREKQIELAILKERESQLRQRRDDMERRLMVLKRMVERAEAMVSNLGVVLNFISGSLQDLSIKVEELANRQQLGLRIILAQEEERRRVAREIHDGPAQTMANMVLRAEILEKLLDLDVERVRSELKDLKEMVRANLHDVRKIIYDLRPMSLDDLGLVPALRRYVADFEEKNKIRAELRFLGREKRLNTALEVAAFRFVQEAMNNAMRHGKSDTILVRVEIAPKKMSISVKDEGVGFDYDKVMADKEGRCFGLMGMRERAELLDGKLEVKSKIGEGTKVTLQIPLVEDEMEGDPAHGG